MEQILEEYGISAVLCILGMAVIYGFSYILQML